MHMATALAHHPVHTEVASNIADVDPNPLAASKKWHLDYVVESTRHNPPRAKTLSLLPDQEHSLFRHTTVRDAAGRAPSSLFLVMRIVQLLTELKCALHSVWRSQAEYGELCRNRCSKP